jgi:hypothetical protein
MLDEPALIHKRLELVGGNEVVVYAILLARAGGARGVRYAEAEAVWIFGEEAREDGGFAGAAGAGDYDGAVGGEGFAEV